METADGEVSQQLTTNLAPYHAENGVGATDRATSDAAGAELAQVRLVSSDPYQLTADLLAWDGQRAAERGVSGPGALGPVAVFGLDVLMVGAAECGLRSWRIDEVHG